MDIAALQATLRRFAAERGWEPFHTPKNLATALLVEAAELAEVFQWLTPQESAEAGRDAVVRERIGDELADVLLYLAQLADHTGVDVETAIEKKLAKNARKHPPVRPGLPAGAGTTGAAAATVAAVATVGTATRDVHVLVDWENVQPKEADLRALVPDATDLWLFHGPQQRRVGTHHPGFGERVTLVPIARTGKNALDFHLTFYMGYIAARHPDARFVVLSNDQGYAPMLAHACQLGFDALAVGFGGRRSPAARARKAPAARAAKVAKATRKAPAKKAAAKAPAPPLAKKAAVAPAARKSAATGGPAVKKAAARKAPSPRRPSSKASAATAEMTAPRATPNAAATAVDPTAIARRLAEQLRAMTQMQRPTRRARLLGFIGSRLGASTDPAARLAVLEALVAHDILEVDATGAVRYP